MAMPLPCTSTNPKSIKRKSRVRNSRPSLSSHLNFNILDYVKRFATEEALRETEKHEQSSDDESSMSDFSEDETKDMEL